MKTEDVYLASMFVSFLVVWTGFMITAPLGAFLNVGGALSLMLFGVLWWGFRREDTDSDDGESNEDD